MAHRLATAGRLASRLARATVCAFHRRLGFPYPRLLTPFVSGVEFFGGLFLLLGFMTRISAGALGITMIVAIRAAKWADVDSLETLLGFDEFEYLALFLWLAIAGPGVVSVDAWLQRWYQRVSGRPVAPARTGQAFV